MLQTGFFSDSAALCSAKFPHHGEREKKAFLQSECGLETGRTDGRICVCEIYSVDDDSSTSQTPFPFAAAVILATHEAH